MGASLRWRHIAQAVRIALTERPARSGQDDLVDPRLPGARVFRQGLEDGRVLAVDGQQGCTPLPHSRQEHLPPHHQRFLVGQQQALACTRCCQTRRQTCSAHDGSHHGIHFRCTGDFIQRLRTRQHLRAQPMSLQFFLQCARMLGLNHHRKAGTKTDALLEQQIDLSRCAQGEHFKTLRMPRHHIQCAGPDRPRGTQNRDPHRALHFTHACHSSQL